jgi:DNA/RNA endonuclease G (NUC1)
MSRATFESRLKGAVARLQQSDGRLATELEDVRASRRRAAGAEPESLPAHPSLPGDLANETIVLRTGRPVLAVREDAAELTFEDAESEVWRERLTAAAAGLGRAIRAAGRIEVDRHELDWLGTGWLVADDVVVTNRHVAREFGRREGDRFVFRQGFGGTMSSRIDFREEIGGGAAREFQLARILHIEDESGPDVAFLQVTPRDGDALAAPIPLGARTAQEKQQVAVIGYPARDSRIPEQDLMLRIFGNVFDKKRLAPGQVKRVQGGLVLHDCSTLGGNSGSVVLDLESGEALALHFSGRFLDANFAVPAPVIAERLRGLREGVTRPKTVVTARPSVAVPVPGRGASISIPLVVRIEIGEPQADVTGGSPLRPPAASPDDDGEPDGETIEEARPEDYADRRGYDPDFLGETIDLPQVQDDADVLSFMFDGRKLRELKYEHFSVVMSKSRRFCRYSAANIDGSQPRKVKRPGWRRDPRIRADQQIDGGVYGNPPRFSRGHMTRREDPIWGTPESAARGNSDSMHVTNAVPQMQVFNAGIWLGLENYALENARHDRMRISVFTGPVLRDDDRILFGVQVPTTFWKVIAFEHDDTHELCATGYTLKDESVGDDEFVFGTHKTTQVPLAAIEGLAGVTFPAVLRRLDPLEGVATESAPRALTDFAQIRFV